MASEAQAHNDGKAQGSRAQHRRNARSGQGIIEANRKTAICKHWLQGVCPFGARCAFAHGAKELRNATAKPSPPPETVKAKHLQSSASRDATTSCSEPRCTVHPGAFSDGESWLLEAKSPVTDQGSRDEDGHGHRGVWLETRGHSAGGNNPYLRGTLRENESWAKIAQGTPIHGRENDCARASNVTAATTTTTAPSYFYGDEHCRNAFRETKAHAAGPAPCSSGVVCRCRTRSNRDTPRAVGCAASFDPEPTFATTGLAFSPRGCSSSPAPLNLGPPSAPQRSSTAAPAAAHRWNPVTYNGSALLGSFASSLQENAEARKPSPSPAPIPRHEMDDLLGRMMSVLSLDVSRSNDDDASRDVGPSVPQSWYDPVLLRPVGEKEPARLKTAQQQGGPSGDSSRPDQSYRSDSLGKSVAPDRDSLGTFTTSADAFSIPSIGSILEEKWPTVLPAGRGLKPSSSMAMAPSTRVHNDVLTNPGGSFSHSLWSCTAVRMRWLLADSSRRSG
ncbi:hypothetical protein Esi_0042_0128 [Ectocarpus siliculosus]|uniref:C3H1-type domain-containing protein n=1 Tax=Ectocarpus siliculosus TaxID=2880 RepID=D7G0T5_ECTSI|nr:hypothetical protein Esi_0042_0128 [Ectocarpus siliculosus]|eukprot:CBJ26748.1 hypothetical protein Esi_0042_0128 [Ectocarpus siliculosus]